MIIGVSTVEESSFNGGNHVGHITGRPPFKAELAQQLRFHQQNLHSNPFKKEIKLNNLFKVFGLHDIQRRALEKGRLSEGF
jgi:hypothetical protein